MDSVIRKALLAVSLVALCVAAADAQAKSPAPTSLDSFLDRCVKKMGASPEYAWAMANPKAKISGDPLTYAKMGLMLVFVWPGSPGAGDQRTPFPGSPEPAPPIAPTPDQRSEDTFQTEAVILAGAYRELHAQMLNNGASEARATASAVTEVKTDARIWCTHVTQLQYFQQ